MTHPRAALVNGLCRSFFNKVTLNSQQTTTIPQLKAIVIDDKLKVCHHVSVDFDNELAEYKTRGGVHKSDDGTNRVTAPVNMWLKAIDVCLDKLKRDGIDFSNVRAISGCAQQHGSVWWRNGSASLLANLNPNEQLHKQLEAAFSLCDTPIWMDSSTSDECRLIEQHVGGPARLAQITGSRAYERFTGPQIAKILRHRRETYLASERITLVSNFLATILSGSYAPLDASDASGMNMMDIGTKRWSNACLEAIILAGATKVGGSVPPTPFISPQVCEGACSAIERGQLLPPGELESELAGLRARLGCTNGSTVNSDNIIDSNEVVGRVSRYFVERYGFPPECLISSFTGDNPGSMAGLCVAPDELIISLGTSDTAFFWLDHPHPGVNGHVLRNPLDATKYMGLICFKNGSKTRERIRDHYARDDWQEFERLLGQVPRANLGNIGFYYDLREIYPLVSGDFRYNKLDQRVDSFGAPELEVRACLEGQFMRLYHHSEALGLDMAKIRRVLVTGGASNNRAILQVIADIFHTPVYILESVSNSASLGGAYLAKYAHALEQRKLDRSGVSLNGTPSPSSGFSQMIRGPGSGHREDNGDSSETSALVLAAKPTPEGNSTSDSYRELLARYIKLETEISLNNEA